MKDERAKQQRYFDLGENCFWLSSQNTLVEDALRPHLRRLAGQGGGRPRIVDLGCGPGNTSRRLQHWGTVYGFDYSLDALAFARGKGIRRVLSGDSTALPFAAGSVDCLVALDVIEHIEDDEAALREIARVLRPGGVFLFTVPASMALWRYHDEVYGHYRRYGRADFVGKVRRAGLQVAACHFFKLAFFVPLWLLARLERLGALPRRDNFYAVPRWLNRLLEAEIVWENRWGLTRHAPVGVSLLCIGQR